MDKPTDELPLLYLEAAQVVVLLPPLGSIAETGRAIEHVRRALIKAKSDEREEIAAYHDEKASEHEALLEESKGSMIGHHEKILRTHMRSAQTIRNRGRDLPSPPE